ncbi:MAG: hypothetical protein HOP19_01680 [Acidobacteria bacterium]|nr:hypothetical protein [Acidobacteriota bacterium]
MRITVVRMTRVAVIFGALLWFGAGAVAKAQSLYEKSFTLAADGEAQLALTASSPNADWAVKGREAAVVTINVDGAYQQDLFLFGGASAFTYHLSLGKLAAGKHQLQITHNAKQSAAQAGAPLIQAAEVLPYASKDTRTQLAVAHAPVLIARLDTLGRFSDIPLLLSYEFVPGEALMIRYSVIFTNEDGGTQTAALMARWGRATDIEWVYEVTLDAAGKIAKAEYQGSNHRVLPFQGEQLAQHPVLYVATVNNNFADQPFRKEAQTMRFALAPVEHDSLKMTRESVMDLQPWSHRVMAAEILRENRIAKTDDEIAGLSGMRLKIAPFRRYLYLDFDGEVQNAGLSFLVKLKGDAQWYASDLGNPSFRITRNGWARTTVRLPRVVEAAQIEKLAVRCDALPETFTNRDVTPPEPRCQVKAWGKMFLLKADDTPGAALAFKTAPLSLRVGEMREVTR